MRILSKQEARDFLVTYQMINTTRSLSGKEGVLSVMNKLKSIQYDPLDVVGKNTDLVLQARVVDYKRAQINELLYTDRTLIDGWDKMMAVHLTEDFPKLSHLRQWRHEAHVETLQHRLQLNALDYLEEIENHIRIDGPKYANDFKIAALEKHKWGSMKASSAALDTLFFQGRIGVRARRNTQKQYDLIENLFDDIATTSSPFESEEDFIEYYLFRRIKALGLLSNKSGVHVSGPFIQNKKTRILYLNKLLDKSLIEAIQIEGINEVFYIPVVDQSNIELSDKITFLAPLDNLVWDRKILENVFDFHYRWEVYTPIKKRKYGYYVLPILRKSDIVGRIEFKKHRKQEKLEIINIWYEPTTKRTKELEKLLNDALKRFEKFLQSANEMKIKS